MVDISTKHQTPKLNVGGGGGGTPLYRVDFVHFSLESGMVFEGTTGV